MDIFPACQVIKKGDRLGIDVATRYGDQFQEALKKQKGYVQVILKKPEKPATEAQNKTFHGLLGLYYKSGLHSCTDPKNLRETIKKSYGVSEEVALQGEKYLILPSWSKYTREQRIRAIDGLISEMEQSGILGSKYSEEYQEFLCGMNG